jgi:transcriptional regulator with XRE-family HTH domain
MTIAHFSDTIKEALDKINKLKDEAPRDWAEQIAKRMGKSVSTVRDYANGASKGIRNGGTLEVLKHLNDLISERNKEIKKEINKAIA